MNNKCYVDVAPSRSRKFPARPAAVGLLLSVAGGLLLAACSSQGSSFGGGAGAGVVDNSAGSGNTGNPGGGSTTGPSGGGAGPTSGGDTGAGDAPGSGGQSVGQGGAAPGGGAGPTGGGAGPAGGAGPNGGAGPSAGAGPAGGAPPGGAGAGSGPACPKPAGQICHEFFAADNSRNQILYVNEFDPTKNWTKKVTGNASQNSPRAIQVVDHAGSSNGKAVMVSIEKGFQEFDMATGASLSMVSTFSGITSALRIPAGDTHTSLPAGTTILAILGTGNAAQLAYVSPTGATVKPTVTMAFAAAGTEMRKLERDPATGNLSFTKYESTTTAYIYIVTELGASVSKIKLPAGAKGYNAIWLDGGKMQATTGDQASVITIDAAGAVSATLGGKNMVKDASGAIVYTDFFSGFFRLPNGNVVAANWLGHQDPAAHPTTPELLEFSPDNKLAWSWGNQTLATFVTFGYFLR